MDRVVWEKCDECKRTKVCEANLWKLRGLCGLGVAGFGALGFAALPLAGFGAGGIIGGSAAAAWQSMIGSVTAGSLFAILTSLGAGIGPLLFGSTAAAVSLLATLAIKLDWCDDKKAGLRILSINNECSDGCMSGSYQIRIAHINKLDFPLTQEFKQGDILWQVGVFKFHSPLSDCFGIKLVGNGQIKAVVRLYSGEQRVKRVQRVKSNSATETNECLCIDDVISWNELINPDNQFIKDTAIIFEVDIIDAKCFPYSPETFVRPKLRTLFSDKPVKPKTGFFDKNKPTLKITNRYKTCKDGCVTVLQLTVNNIRNLNCFGKCVTESFNQRKNKWELRVFKYMHSEYLSLQLIPSKSCKTKIVVQLQEIEKVIVQDVEANNTVRINDIIMWNELIDPRCGFVKGSSLTFEVEIIDGLYLQDPCDQTFEN